MTLPLTKCLKCNCGFQGDAGFHEYQLCNRCAVEVGKAADKRIPYYRCPTCREVLFCPFTISREKGPIFFCSKCLLQMPIMEYEEEKVYRFDHSVKGFLRVLSGEEGIYV